MKPCKVRCCRFLDLIHGPSNLNLDGSLFASLMFTRIQNQLPPLPMTPPRCINGTVKLLGSRTKFWEGKVEGWDACDRLVALLGAVAYEKTGKC